MSDLTDGHLHGCPYVEEEGAEFCRRCGGRLSPQPSTEPPQGEGSASKFMVGALPEHRHYRLIRILRRVHREEHDDSDHETLTIAIRAMTRYDLLEKESWRPIRQKVKAIAREERAQRHKEIYGKHRGRDDE